MRLSRLGVGRTFQTLQVFGKMSVRDNLLVCGADTAARCGAACRARRFGPRAQGDALIEQFRIRHVADSRAGELSYGQQSWWTSRWLS